MSNTSNPIITSRQNPIVKELQAIRDDRTSDFLFLEGPRLVEELIDTNLSVESLVWTTASEADPVVAAVQKKAKKRYRVAQTVFEAISDVKSPQGILAIVKRPLWGWADVVRSASSPILILDGVQDPGNMATILRTAEASGVSGLVTTPETARLFSPKALRGAMGSTLRLPILEHQSIENIAAQMKTAGYRLVGTSAAQEGSLPHTKLDWTVPSAIVLGHEGQGLSKSWTSQVASWVHIPMRAPVESLNVAAAAAILLYEVSRQNA